MYIFFVLAVLGGVAGNSQGLESVGQAMIVVCLGLAAAFALGGDRVRRHQITPLEMILLGAGSFSAVVAMICGYPISAQYSLVFLLVICCIATLARSMTPYELLRVASVALMCCLLVHMITSGADLVQALSVTVTDTGLFRFSPLGMHPNLTGLVYSGMAALLVAQALQPIYSTAWRLTCGAFSLIALILVVAASARSSLLALVAVVVLLTFRVAGLKRGAATFLALGGVVVVSLLVFATNSSALDWLSSILEMDSDTRGIESGGSGRTELWIQGVALLWTDAQRFAVGGGFRSADVDIIGFFVENSYIGILLELGIVVGGIVIAGYFFVTGSVFAQLGEWVVARSSWMLPYSAVLLVNVIESGFNRYLISIGNPLSLISLTFAICVALQRPRGEPATEP